MTTPAIAIENLRKVYRKGFFLRQFQALERLDLNVEQGEIFGFVGPNGAGKTTAIKILVGLNRATEGSVRIFGIPNHELAARRRFGFLPERPYFYSHLTAREFLDFYGQLYDLPGAVRRPRVQELLERVGLAHAAESRLGSLSKGMLQRIGVAQTLLNDPDLVVLDEPMSGLDPMGRAQVRDIIADLGQRGKTVFFSSHVLSDVEQICDRVGILARGKLHEVGKVDELLEKHAHGVQVVLSQVDAELLARIEAGWGKAEQSGGRVSVVAPDRARAQALIRLAAGAGAEIDDIGSVRPTLEELFVDELEAGERKVGARD